MKTPLFSSSRKLNQLLDLFRSISPSLTADDLHRCEAKAARTQLYAKGHRVRAVSIALLDLIDRRAKSAAKSKARRKERAKHVVKLKPIA